MINILIVEDEFAIALDIESRLINLGYNSSGISSSYNEALPILLENNNIDIVLLDINLGKGKSGIDLGMLIKEKFKIPIIFLTAYSDDKTFNEAEKAQPMGYIIKPFNDSDINRTIKIALKRYSEIKQDKNTQKKETYNSDIIFIKDKGKINKVLKDEILWLEAMDNYTIVHTLSEKFIANLFLKDFLEKLNSVNFFRIHKSHAIALDKISRIEDDLVFINDKYLIISRKYKKKLINILNLL